MGSNSLPIVHDIVMTTRWRRRKLLAELGEVLDRAGVTTGR
jgi:hypothetical protein